MNSALRTHTQNVEDDFSTDDDLYLKLLEAAGANGVSLEEWLSDALSEKSEAASFAKPAQSTEVYRGIDEEENAELLFALEELNQKIEQIPETEPVVEEPRPFDESVNLRARIAILKARLSEPDNPHAQPFNSVLESIDNQPDQSDAEMQFPKATPADSEQIEIRLNGKLDLHFDRLEQNLNSLFNKRQNKAAGLEALNAKMSENLAKLDSRFSNLSTKSDVALLHPLAQLQVKLHQDQNQMDENIQHLMGKQVLQEPRINETLDKIDASLDEMNAQGYDLTAEIATLLDLAVVRLESRSDMLLAISRKNQQSEDLKHLEKAVKKIKPEMTSDLAALLDLAVHRLEKHLSTSSSTANMDIFAERLQSIEDLVHNFPVQVAASQPNLNALQSVLPTRESIEGIEATVRHVEALLMDKSRTAEPLLQSQVAELNQALDGLQSRLDDAIKKFDLAGAKKNKAIEQQFDSLESKQDNFGLELRSYFAQVIEAIEKRFANDEAKTETKADSSNQSRIDYDFTRIEEMIGTLNRSVRDTLKSNQELNDKSNAIPEALEAIVLKLETLELNISAIGPKIDQVQKPVHQQIIVPEGKVNQEQSAQGAGSFYTKTAHTPPVSNPNADARHGMDYIAAARRASRAQSHDTNSHTAATGSTSESKTQATKRINKRRYGIFGTALCLMFLLGMVLFNSGSNKSSTQLLSPLTIGHFDQGQIYSLS